MVSSMMGLIYLSGRIDVADELNTRLIKDAISIYKDIRGDYTSAYPIYPTGTFRIKDKGIFTVGLYVPEKNIAYIGIWKINTDKSEITVDLSKYGNVKKAQKIYPELSGYTLTYSGNNIKAEFPEGNCAMFTKIEF
jgi:alpha-galactosidase